jgi:hypothetical protein
LERPYARFKQPSQWFTWHGRALQSTAVGAGPVKTSTIWLTNGIAATQRKAAGVHSRRGSETALLSYQRANMASTRDVAEGSDHELNIPRDCNAAKVVYRRSIGSENLHVKRLFFLVLVRNLCQIILYIEQFFLDSRMLTHYAPSSIRGRSYTWDLWCRYSRK